MKYTIIRIVFHLPVLRVCGISVGVSLMKGTAIKFLKWMNENVLVEDRFS